jgi:hypothetical protein
MSTSTDDEATVRIGRASVPGRSPHGQAEDKPPQRHRIEIASRLFGAFAGGMLLVGVDWILWNGAGTTAEKSTAVWQTLALAALAGLCVGVLRLAARTRELNSCIRELRSQVAGLNLATEASAQQVMSMLRAVAFSVGEDRSEGNEHRALVVELCRQVVERAEAAAAFEVDRLRADVEALRAEAGERGEWLDELRRDIDAISVPGVTDLEPIKNLRTIGARLRGTEN